MGHKTQTLLGARVRILQSATTAGRPHKFAGHLGIVTGRDASSPSVIRVRTDSGLMTRVRAAHLEPSNAKPAAVMLGARPQIHAGERVRVCAEGARLEYKGKTGTAHRRMATSGRWVVHFDDGTKASVHRQHLVPLEDLRTPAGLHALTSRTMAKPAAERATAPADSRFPQRITNGSYSPASRLSADLMPAPMRPGADDHRQWPSRIGDRRTYLDGRIEEAA
jgi:hypothetical protein